MFHLQNKKGRSFLSFPKFHVGFSLVQHVESPLVKSLINFFNGKIPHCFCFKRIPPRDAVNDQLVAV